MASPKPQMLRITSVAFQPIDWTRILIGNCPAIAPSAARACVIPVINANSLFANRSLVTKSTETKAKADPSPINILEKQAK